MDANRSGSFVAWWTLLAAATLVGASCGSEVSSPGPKVEGEVGETTPENAVVHPGFACNEQQSKWVQVSGKNFTPMVVDVLGEDGQKIRWPRVRITRVKDLDGEAVDDGKSVEVQADGTKIDGESDGEMETAMGALDGGVSDTSGDVGVDGSTETDVAEDTAIGTDDAADDTGTMDAAASDDATSSEDAAATMDTGTEADVGDEDAASSQDDAGESQEDTGATEDAGQSSPDAGGDGKRLVWLDETRLRFKITPEMDLPAGMYDVTVIASRVKKTDQAQEATRKEALGIMPRPTVDNVETKPLCLAQAERQITVSGQHFLRRGEEQVPVVRIGGETYEPDSINDDSCSTPGAPFGPYETCGELTVTVPQGAVGPGAHDVQIENGEPAACHSLPEEDGSSFRVVEPPRVDAIAPDPVCAAQTAYEPVTISGEKFLRVGGEQVSRPTVEIGEFTAMNLELADCQPVDGNVPEGTEQCATIEAQVPAGALPTAEDTDQTAHPVSVTNPGAANCTDDSEVATTSIDPPVVESVGPQPIVGAQDGDRLTITGQRFAVIDGQRPTVTLIERSEEGDDTTTTYTPTALESCREVKGPNERRVNLCERLEIELGEGDVPAGGGAAELELVVENPGPLSCTTERPNDEGELVVPEGQASLQSVEPPSITEISPTPICTKDGTREVIVEGDNLYRVDGRTPTVGIGMQSYPTTVPESADCTAVEPEGALAEGPSVEECSAVAVEVSPEQWTATQQVMVSNPEPVGGYTTETGEVAELQVLDRPSINRVEPKLRCLEEGARTVDIRGDGFVKLVATDQSMGTDAMPEVTASQVNAQATVETVDECETIDEWASTDVMRCQHIEVTVSGDEVGLAELNVENPMPVGCGTDAAGTVRLSPAPTVSSAAPAPSSTCNDANNFRRVVVSGDTFLKRNGTLPEVQLGSQQPIQPRAANDCTDVPDSGEENLQHCKELIVYPETDALDQSRELTVHNPEPSACSTDQVTVQTCP